MKIDLGWKTLLGGLMIADILHPSCVEFETKGELRNRMELENEIKLKNKKEMENKK